MIKTGVEEVKAGGETAVEKVKELLSTAKNATAEVLSNGTASLPKIVNPAVLDLNEKKTTSVEKTKKKTTNEDDEEEEQLDEDEEEVPKKKGKENEQGRRRSFSKGKRFVCIAGHTFQVHKSPNQILAMTTKVSLHFCSTRKTEREILNPL